MNTTLSGTLRPDSQLIASDIVIDLLLASNRIWCLDWGDAGKASDVYVECQHSYDLQSNSHIFKKWKHEVKANVYLAVMNIARSTYHYK